MDGHVFTTKGWVASEQVELRQTITENENERIVRTDKFLKETGEWVGNDVHVHLKHGLAAEGVLGSFA